MNDIWNYIAEICSELHPDRINAFADRIRVADSLVDLKNKLQSFSNRVEQLIFTMLIEKWERADHVTPSELARAMECAAVVTKYKDDEQQIDLVWSGPRTNYMAIRDTEQVILQLIKSAQTRIIIVSFVALKVKSIINALNKAIDRKVIVDILLELPKNKGGRVDVDSFELLNNQLADANLYEWNRDLSGGAVHAKCFIADDTAAFITSANLTLAALEKNMELGVFFQGGSIPKGIHNHFSALINTEVISSINSEK